MSTIPLFKRQKQKETSKTSSLLEDLTPEENQEFQDILNYMKELDRRYPQERISTDQLFQQKVGEFWGSEWFAVDSNDRDDRVRFVYMFRHPDANDQQDLMWVIVHDDQYRLYKVKMKYSQIIWTEGWTPRG
ncbi:MAG: hypothetical protein OXC61_05525 [Flavobacteriaceae bacterium]|nr:hypothetical protein [Flavobacteriaceae bacterium]